MNRQKPNRWWGYGATAVLIGIIGSAIWSSNTGVSNPLLKIPHQLPGGDKLGHAVLFGLLALLIDWVLRYRNVSLGKLKTPLGPLVVLVLALAEEASQLFWSRRSPDLLDAMADIIGVVLVAGGVRLIRWRRKTRFPKA